MLISLQERNECLTVKYAPNSEVHKLQVELYFTVPYAESTLEAAQHTHTTQTPSTFSV